MPPPYTIIYADPPWPYLDYGYAISTTGKRAPRGARKEYPSMTLKEICDVPVGALAANDALLFLWVPWPQLPLACDVMDAWGS